MNFIALCLTYRDKLGYTGTGCNEGELAAFIAYAQAFPKTFLALVDTYETLKVRVARHRGPNRLACCRCVLYAIAVWRSELHLCRSRPG